MSKKSRSESTSESRVELQRWKAEFYELMQLWAYSEQYPALMDKELAPLNRKTFAELVDLMRVLKTEQEMEPYLNRVKRVLVSSLDKEGTSYKRFQKLYSAIDHGMLSAEVLKVPRDRVGNVEEIASALKRFWKKIEREECIGKAARERRKKLSAKKSHSGVGTEPIAPNDATSHQHTCEDPYKARVLEIHSRISRFGTAFTVWATFASIMSVAAVVLVFATYRAPEVDPFLSYAAVVAISLSSLICVVSATALMITNAMRCRNGYTKFCSEERVRMGIKESDDLPHDLASLRKSYLALLAGRIGVGATLVLLAVAVWTGRMWYQSEWGLPATITHEMIAGLVGMVFALFVLTALSLDCTKVMAAEGKVIASLYNSNYQEYRNKLIEKNKNGTETSCPISATRISENLVEHTSVSSEEWGPYMYYTPPVLVDVAELVSTDSEVEKRSTSRR